MSDRTDLVHLAVDSRVATITLDSPANRNALSRQLVEQLATHLSAAQYDADAQVVVLTHTGSTFCAGADLAEAVADGMEHGTRRLLNLLRTVVALPMPVVAVVRGHVRAGGIGLVGACDVALVTDESTFAFTEALLGLAPAIISLTTRTRIGDRDAARLFLTGTSFDGRAAARYGLVTASVVPERLDAELEGLLEELTKVPPQGLQATKALLNRPFLASIDSEGERLVELSARLFASDEAQRAMAAFRRRRTAG